MGCREHALVIFCSHVWPCKHTMYKSNMSDCRFTDPAKCKDSTTHRRQSFQSRLSSCLWLLQRGSLMRKSLVMVKGLNITHSVVNTHYNTVFVFCTFFPKKVIWHSWQKISSNQRLWKHGYNILESWTCSEFENIKMSQIKSDWLAVVRGLSLLATLHFHIHMTIAWTAAEPNTMKCPRTCDSYFYTLICCFEKDAKM